jgi:mannose/cellobiose epimerase-like protein (N-acyl-D-glucosamine 2-epimerase family)
MDKMRFTFSDTIAGYVTSFDPAKETFGLKTTDGREFAVKLTALTYSEVLRNLGEPFQDPGAPWEKMLSPGRYLFAYGTFFPDGGDWTFEAKRIIYTGKTDHEFRFEAGDWWVNQIRELAEFYLHAQFPEGEIDYKNYRTHLTLEGQKIESTRQETDTISRMVYGFASAYLLTGVDRYLECAEKGTEYLRNHLRGVDEEEGIVYWYHATDVQGGRERKIFASVFGDDYDAIPAYEQIYALAGPTQTFRITGDPLIRKDIDGTINLFNKYFKDPKKGGYFSHVDPVDFNPRAESLTFDRARKNWNSVGDHAPAFLINLWLATGEEGHLKFLVETADTIAEHFPDYDNSPFVQEKFHEDWSHDQKWGWQQNRAVVGHNLKIAWNLMRVQHVSPHPEYVALAEKIATLMPEAGMDKQRAGWYDVVERVKGKDDFHHFAWHDRKAWWQQEQAILAYLILAGSLKKDEYLKLARESSAFYNAFFPDHDNGGVYFNVLANGIPYLLGTERLKGSHSMSGYHSFELCYLAAVYSNLMLFKQPMDLYFKPQAGALKDNILRVSPDILPPGSVRIEAVWINGRPYADFDADGLTVHLPDAAAASDAAHPLQVRPSWTGNPSMLPATTSAETHVRVRIAPALVSYDAMLNMGDGDAVLTLEGTFDQSAELMLRAQLDKVVAAAPKRVIINADDLKGLTKPSGRALVFAREKLGLETDVYVVGASDAIKKQLKDAGFLDQVKVVADASEIKPA